VLLSDPQSHIVLFNDVRYQRCNIGPAQRLFRYDHSVDGRLVGTMSGVIDGDMLDCGHSAPFGGIDWARRREPVGSVVSLLHAALSCARDEGIRDVRIRARPAYFGANEVAAEFAVRGLGATVEACEISLGIEVARYSSPEGYRAALKCFARNRLHHGLGGELAFGRAETAAAWAACYDLLAATKHRRGARFKFSLDYLMRLRELFGERIAMHRALRGGDLAAAALVYRVARDWDYLAAWGDDLRHRDSKVMNAMSFHLVCEAFARRIAVIDLGISSVDGVADDGLIQFKRSVGAVTGLRTDYLLSLK
jgi:GNAT acetyltransferase-like protein